MEQLEINLDTKEKASPIVFNQTMIMLMQKYSLDTESQVLMRAFIN